MFRIKNINGRFLSFEFYLISVGVVISFIATAACGQVSQLGRYRHGRALDASPMVGSSGLNDLYYVRSANTGRKSTQLMVEGRTTGLSSFRGGVGYYAPNELNLNLPSRRMDTFNRQSVGIQDVLRGGTYQTKSYYPRSSTTLSPRSIVRQESTGQVVLPGKGMTTPDQKATQKLYNNATKAYLPLMPKLPINSILGNALGILPEGQFDAGSFRAQAFEQQQAALRGGPGMFSLPHLQDRRKLARELSEYGEDQLLESALNEPMGKTLGDKLDSQVVQPLGRIEKPESITNKFDRDKDKESEDEKAFLLRDPTRKSVLPGENQDVYLDLLKRLEEKAQALRDYEDAQALQDYENAKALKPGEAPVVEPIPPGMSRLGMRTVGFTADNKIILRSLAGESEDMFNRYMTRAKKELDAGRFYQAAQYYELASISRPKNPLARLGRCLATFAAEEWYTSASELLKAMEQFPPLMETQLDLKNLMPVKKLDERLDALELWVTRIHDKPALVFLATYMQQNAGNIEKAKKHAKVLKKLELNSLVLNAYVDYVLTGKLPEVMRRKKSDKKKSSPPVPPASPASTEAL